MLFFFPCNRKLIRGGTREGGDKEGNYFTKNLYNLGFEQNTLSCIFQQSHPRICGHCSEKPPSGMPTIKIKSHHSKKPPSGMPIRKIQGQRSKKPPSGMPTRKIQGHHSKKPPSGMPTKEILGHPSKKPPSGMPIRKIQGQCSKKPPSGMPTKEIQGHPSKKPPSGMPTREIQQQILRIPGPIVSIRSFMGQVSLKRFRKINTEEYMKAIDGLEGHYGKLHELNIKGQWKKSKVFVKKIPEEVVKFDLCSADDYAERYRRPCSKSIGEGVKRQLVAQGILTEQQIESENPSKA